MLAAPDAERHAAQRVQGPAAHRVGAPDLPQFDHRATARAPAFTAVDSRPGETFPGTVARVAPFVLDLVEQNRTVEVEADFADPAAAASLLPGTSADVEVILSSRDDVLRIPTAAVAEGGRVLVLEDGVLAERTLAAGLRNWRFTEVTGGVSEGELVVTARESTAVKAGARAVAR